MRRSGNLSEQAFALRSDRSGGTAFWTEGTCANTLMWKYFAEFTEQRGVAEA